jgi:hypothetical protein
MTLAKKEMTLAKKKIGLVKDAPIGPTIKCGTVSCKGFLDKDYFCTMCTNTSCKDCQNILQPGHICDTGVLETLLEIRKTSKPCPTCAAPITKVSGCNDMFCNRCGTPFHWGSGKVIVGAFHNPHTKVYYNQQKALAAQRPLVLAYVRNKLTVKTTTGGRLISYVIRDKESPAWGAGFSNTIYNDVKITVLPIWRYYNNCHIEWQFLNDLTPIKNLGFTSRSKWLENQTTDEKFGALLFKIFKENLLNMSLRKIGNDLRINSLTAFHELRNSPIDVVSSVIIEKIDIAFEKMGHVTYRMGYKTMRIKKTDIFV